MILKKKRFAVLLILALLISMVPASAMAAVSKVSPPVEVNELMSSDHLKHNFVKVTTQGSTLNIQCETPIEATTFGINVRRANPASSESQWLKRAYPVKEDGFYSFEASVSGAGLSNGDYVLVITMVRKPGGKSEVFYKNCNFRVKDGQVSILKYNTIVNANKKIAKKGANYSKSRFTDKYLGDVKNLLFRNPKTGKVAPVTKAKVNYFKKVSDSVTKGAKTNYDKVLKIYEYIAENVYYDDIAFATKKNQYLDPYLNLYNMRNKKTSANSSKGRVATVCVGNAGLVAALSRAQGIPARVVNGHHVGLGATYYNWTTEPNKATIDHWWAEVYVDGRWIVVDPTAGTGNKWNRNTGVWTKTGLQNYIYFDPTMEQLSTSHVTYNIRGKGL